MGTKWFARSAATGLAVGVLAVAGATAARANSTVNINPGNVPTTAKAYTQNCDDNLGGGPYAGQDVWVFNLPKPNTSGHFVSVTATFDTGSGTVTKTITADGGAIVQIGTSKAWIKLPAGWTLTGATAVISGSADFFVLTHTCAAKGSPSPSPSSSSSSPKPSTSPSKPGGGGSPTPSASTSTTASPTTSPGTGGGVSPTSSPTSGSGGGSLPITGAPLALTVLLGGTLLAAGASAAVLARRRRQQQGA
jgi:hypothetical protein